MNIGSCAVLWRLLGAAASVLFGCCAASSSLSCVLVNDAILFLDAFFALFRLLPMTCLLAVLALARLSLAVGVVGGPAWILADRRGLITVRAGRGSALALPLSIIWGCLGLSPRSTLSLRM